MLGVVTTALKLVLFPCTHVRLQYTNPSPANLIIHSANDVTTFFQHTTSNKAAGEGKRPEY